MDATVDDRSKRFLEHLYAEKELHKEHRHKHVMQKLTLSSAFFGLGQFSGSTPLAHLFLYIVPFIALVHDVYIFAEHFKVHRTGIFVRKTKFSSVCKLERAWEDYANSHREVSAKRASFAYTILITLLSIASVYVLKVGTSPVHDLLFWAWVITCAIATLGVFGYSLRLQWKIRDMDSALTTG
jgi:hypothetical protein